MSFKDKKIVIFDPILKLILSMKFDLQTTAPKSKARAGVLYTDHGVIETPIFMPVGTLGSVKTVQFRDLEEQVKAQIILGNSYHLYLRPGTDTLEKAGGLHKFIGWDKPILTDSGGFQVFSLGEIRKIKEEGAEFRSHIDGSKHLFTPESVINLQRKIGSDIMMAFDECTPGDADFTYARKSLELTQRWLGRCVDEFKATKPLYGHEQALFPIVQGCVYPELRKKAAEHIASLDMVGNAIGGLSVGESEQDMYSMVEVVNEILPTEKPRYLMGVGTPVNILENIDRGVDMFDCVMPTRNARNGMIFTWNGVMNMKNKKWEHDFSAIDPNGDCDLTRTHSKAYLRHLFKSGELLAGQIASIHNLSFYLALVKEARKHILDGTFASWKKDMVKQVGKKL